MSGPARRGEALAAALLVVAASGARAEPAADRRTLPAVEIVDGLGQSLGEVMGGSILGDLATIPLRLDGRVYPVGVTLSGLARGTAVVGFAAADCAGPPLLFEFVPRAPVTPRTGVAPDGTLLVEDGADPVPRLLGSTFGDFQSPPCQPSAETVAAFSTVPLLAAGTVVPPLRPRLHPARGEPGGQRLPGVPVVVDATGQPLGPVYDDSGGPVVILRDGRRPPVAMHVASDRFTGSLSSARFESTDCSGPVLVTARTSPRPVFPVTAVGPGNLLHAGTGDPFLATLRSSWSVGLAACQTSTSPESLVLATTVLMDLDRFVPPFTLR